MHFRPESYCIADEPMKPFIDPEEIWELLNRPASTDLEVERVIARSLDKQRLTLQEVAILINAAAPEQIKRIKEGARELKRKIYGNRVVLFAPLYVGNKCSNECTYCGFRASNKSQVRKTLTGEELKREIEVLEDNGQKRLILVYG
ncbi:MAG: thiamine biosynthesis protein ThiH, partial [Proteiniphilum sp. 51_7]